MTAAPAHPGTAPAPAARRRWHRTPALVAGLAVLGALVLLAVVGPWLSPHDPIAQNPRAILRPPSAEHWLGTDHLGRDVWARLWHAARADLAVGALAIVAPFVIGTALGCLAGYCGGWTDRLIMRVVDVVVAFPYYVLVIAMVFAMGPGTGSIIVAIAAVGWVSYCRIIRAEILVARRQDYVLAARSGGLSHARVLVRHVLPNTLSQSLVYAMTDIVLAILAIVTLGYLGLGVTPPTPDWGQMVADGQAFLTTHWTLATVPGVAVIWAGLGLSLIGDGLSDLLAPEGR